MFIQCEDATYINVDMIAKFYIKSRDDSQWSVCAAMTAMTGYDYTPILIKTFAIQCEAQRYLDSILFPHCINRGMGTKIILNENK